MSNLGKSSNSASSAVQRLEIAKLKQQRHQQQFESAHNDESHHVNNYTDHSSCSNNTTRGGAATTTTTSNNHNDNFINEGRDSFDNGIETVLKEEEEEEGEESWRRQQRDRLIVCGVSQIVRYNNQYNGNGTGATIDDANTQTAASSSVKSMSNYIDGNNNNRSSASGHSNSNYNMNDMLWDLEDYWSTRRREMNQTVAELSGQVSSFWNNALSLPSTSYSSSAAGASSGGNHNYNNDGRRSNLIQHNSTNFNTSLGVVGHGSDNGMMYNGAAITTSDFREYVSTTGEAYHRFATMRDRLRKDFQEKDDNNSKSVDRSNESHKAGMGKNSDTSNLSHETMRECSSSAALWHAMENVPQQFFDDDFDVTALEKMAVENIGDNESFGSTSNLFDMDAVEMSSMQETLSHYMDVVESSLSLEIASQSKRLMGAAGNI